MELPYLILPALRAAFAHNRENHGCAGADGVTLAEFEQSLDGHLDIVRGSVLDGSYWAWPLRRVVVEKKPGSPETRTLLIAAVRDRVLQTAVAAYMEPHLEREFDECSFGYRRGRGVRMAVERVHALQAEGYTWLVDADIGSFFDSVDRALVLDRLATLIPSETAVRLCNLWLDYTAWDGLNLTRPALGLPQGLVVSPMLANLCLDTLDDRLTEAGVRMVRYSDDFVVLAKSEPAAQSALKLAAETLEQLHLRFKDSKTRVVRFSDGFKFLGVIFLKDLLATPYRAGARQRLRVISSAPGLPAPFFPSSERRPLRHYKLV
jgi:group II intron reverse transcriptase/maturase